MRRPTNPRPSRTLPFSSRWCSSLFTLTEHLFSERPGRNSSLDGNGTLSDSRQVSGRVRAFGRRLPQLARRTDCRIRRHGLLGFREAAPRPGLFYFSEKIPSLSNGKLTALALPQLKDLH